MESNEIMENEEVVEAAEEVVTKANSGKVFKMATGIGLVVLTGVIIYKYVRPVVYAKLKPVEKTAVDEKPAVIEAEVVSPETEETEEETSK